MVENNGDGLLITVLTGLKGKSPARQVGGKCTRLLSDKAKAATSQLTAKECGFYEKRFTVSLGKDNDSMTATSSSTTVKAKPMQPKPKKTQPKPPPTTRCANSAPPSPKKRPPAPDPTTPPNKPARASTSKARRNVITDTNDDMTEDNIEVDEGNEDGEGDESGNEQDMDEDPLQKYLRMRDDIQAERMMFTPGELKDKASDKSKKGHICKGCMNWGTHGEMYLKICQKMGIKPNEHALPNPEDMPSDTTMQTHLDGFVQATPNVKWSKEGLLEHILDFIISGDQLLKYQHPATQESDIPHRTKIREEVIEKANLAIRRLKEEFKNLDCAWQNLRHI
ncbi:hypothetical protein CPB84DRAFT_1873503 [Gymnopilus junonius]|uniref:Uncharacterized protein n=1 Tax=Gymnopilus junonius TaxID=109634 RepID=A0A9P5NC20_GYMJU|nr:hypothetical protein CPB84DRAFT_1873503 [Gymnopilus junonius]